MSLNVQILQMDTEITDGYRSYRIATDITLAARTCRRSLRTAMSTGVWVLEVLPRQAERVQRGRFVHPTTPPPSLLKTPTFAIGSQLRPSEGMLVRFEICNAPLVAQPTPGASFIGGSSTWCRRQHLCICILILVYISLVLIAILS